MLENSLTGEPPSCGVSTLGGIDPTIRQVAHPSPDPNLDKSAHGSMTSPRCFNDVPRTGGASGRRSRWPVRTTPAAAETREKTNVALDSARIATEAGAVAVALVDGAR